MYSAQQSLALNNLNGRCFASDSLSNIETRYNTVISNPPFHQGIKTDYGATESFLTGINRHLTSDGQLLIVANSFLKYQPIMQQHFAVITNVSTKKGFTVYRAIF